MAAVGPRPVSSLALDPLPICNFSISGRTGLQTTHITLWSALAQLVMPNVRMIPSSVLVSQVIGSFC